MQSPYVPALAALLIVILVGIWAARHEFVQISDKRVQHIYLGTGAEQQRFTRDAQGRWRVASFDNVPADEAALTEILAQSIRGKIGPTQVAIAAYDAQGRRLARGGVGRTQASSLLQRPYARALFKPPALAPTALRTAMMMGDAGSVRLLNAQEHQKILHILNDLNPRAIRPGSTIAWREVVMVELRLARGERLYVQATHDGRWLWIRLTGNAAPHAGVTGRDMGQRFNDFRNFAYAIAPERWPAALLPSQPKCDPTLSPTPCPKHVP